MSKYIPAINGFLDKRSTYETKNEGGKLHIFGVCYINGVAIKFSLNGKITDTSSGGKQKKKQSKLRGGMSILSPAENRILQVTGEELRKRQESGNPNLNASAMIYIDTLDEKKIKTHIERSAINLFEKHSHTIHAVQRKMGQGVRFNSSEAADLYLDRFIVKFYGRCIAKTQRGVKNAIGRVTVFFGHVAMGEVTPAMIKGYSISRKECTKGDLSYARKFWDYCREMNVYSGENPLDTYIKGTTEKRRNKANPDIAISKANELPCIDMKTEGNLKRIIFDNRNDGIYMGLLLAMEGFTSKDAKSFIWGDINFQTSADYISIKEKKEYLTGATHDFTRPLSPFAKEILTSRYHMLLKEYPKAELLKMPIVADSKSPQKSVESKVLTSLCKSALIEAGIKKHNLPNVRGETHGAGIRLLLRNAEYRLVNDCGLGSDPAAVSFLMGRSLQESVTSDHYRDFTGPEGQTYLYNALKRDKRFIENTKAESYKKITQETLPNGMKKYSVQPVSANKITSIAIKLKLKRGIIYVTGPQGVSCSGTVR